MRTNIELNEDLLAEAQKYSTAKTKRAVVEEALSAFTAMK
jgi:Arc/MetJ family transcription regulator